MLVEMIVMSCTRLSHQAGRRGVARRTFSERDSRQLREGYEEAACTARAARHSTSVTVEPSAPVCSAIGAMLVQPREVVAIRHKVAAVRWLCHKMAAVRELN